MKTYTLYWKTGKKEILQGSSVADAMDRAQIRSKTLSVLDFYAEGHDDKYVFVAGQWTRKEESKMEPDIADLDEQDKKEKKEAKFSGSSFFFGLMIGLYVALFVGGIIGKCSMEEQIAKETQSLLQQQGIIKFSPQTGKLQISPEFNTNNYYWYQGIPGVKLEWWQ